MRNLKKSLQIGLRYMENSKFKEAKYTKLVYSYDVISKAIRDYKDICQITLFETDDSYICSFFYPEEENLSIIIKEFSNYLIELSGIEHSYVDN